MTCLAVVLLCACWIETGAACGPPASAARPEAPVSPRASPSPTPGAVSPAPTGLRIVEASMRATPATYVGRCPFQVTFSGRLSVVGGAGTVVYRFTRSDAAAAPSRSLAFDGPGTREVTTSWSLGGSYAGWQAIEVLSPQHVESNHAAFAVTCE